MVLPPEITYSSLMLYITLQKLLTGVLVLSLVSSMSSAAPRRQVAGDNMSSLTGAETELRKSIAFAASAGDLGCGDSIGGDANCALDHSARTSIGLSCCSCTCSDAADVSNTGKELGRIEFGFYALNQSGDHSFSMLKPPRI